MLFSTLFLKYKTDEVNPKKAYKYVSAAAKRKAVTATTTAVVDDFCELNTIGGSVPGSGIIITLPADPTSSDTVKNGTIYFFDAGRNLANKPVVIARNGKKIMGKAEDLTLDTNGASIALTYVDSTVGWEVTGNANDASRGVVLISPDGSKFVLTVVDNGTLSATKLT